MTRAPSGGAGDVVQVLGAARAGDPVTATARGIATRLAHTGRSARVVAGRVDGSAQDLAEAGGTLEAFDTAQLDGTVVVHSVDGGEELERLLPGLSDKPLRLIHHGSAVGSDRHVLRRLRTMTAATAAASPAARDELRALGFDDVAVIPLAELGGALDGVLADQATASNLERHPGPLILCVGPIAPNRSLELLLDAFADLVTGPRPGATLSICGPATPWYATALRRRILSLGLMACELVDPTDDRAVAARVDHAHGLVALRPAALDPYVERAVRAGASIVAPLGPTTAHHLGRGLVPIPSRTSRGELVEALATATATRPTARSESAPSDLLTDADLLRLLRVG